MQGLTHRSDSTVKWRSTTILCVRREGHVALGGDGQVTLGNTIMKHDTRKIRWMLDDKGRMLRVE